MTLEQLARERGVLLSDKSTPCMKDPNMARPGNWTSTTDNNSISAPGKGQCVITFLGADLNTASFAMYTFSLSVLMQSLIIISMSGAADHGRYRKTLLVSFAFSGAFATMLFLFVVPKVYLLAALLAIIANTSFGASFVLLNSFLPLIVRYHPSIQYVSATAPPDLSANIVEDDTNDERILAQGETVSEDVADSTAMLLPTNNVDRTLPHHKSASATSPELQLSTKVSSYGIGIGYIAAVLVQTVAIGIVIYTRNYAGSSTRSLRLVLFVIGLWWFCFTIPASLWLRPRPGPLLKPNHSRSHGWLRMCFMYINYSWWSLGRTILRARRLQDVLLFLCAWFMLSDGIATVSGTAVLFAKTTLEMKTEALALITVVSTLSGVIGAFTWSTLSRSMGLSPSQTILCCLCLFELIPIYGLLGYLPPIKRLGVFGLQQPWEMYPVGALYGFVIGGISSYARSLYGELIPPGSEAAFYALYAITDKGSSVFGPAIVGAITDANGEIRPVSAALEYLLPPLC